MMEEQLSNKNANPPARCSECDRMMDNYYEFVSPTNEKRIVCWECQMRDEKNFFAKRDFQRRSRRGVIPR